MLRGWIKPISDQPHTDRTACPDSFGKPLVNLPGIVFQKHTHPGFSLHSLPKHITYDESRLEVEASGDQKKACPVPRFAAHNIPYNHQ